MSVTTLHKKISLDKYCISYPSPPNQTSDFHHSDQEMRW